MQKGTKKSSHRFPEGMCLRCGKTDHSAKDCWFINSKYLFSQIKGHTEVVCLQKKKGKELVGYIIEEEPIQIVNSIPGDDSMTQQLQLNGK